MLLNHNLIFQAEKLSVQEECSEQEYYQLLDQSVAFFIKQEIAYIEDDSEISEPSNIGNANNFKKVTHQTLSSYRAQLKPMSDEFFDEPWKKNVAYAILLTTSSVGIAYLTNYVATKGDNVVALNSFFSNLPNLDLFTKYVIRPHLARRTIRECWCYCTKKLFNNIANANSVVFCLPQDYWTNESYSSLAKYAAISGRKQRLKSFLLGVSSAVTLSSLHANFQLGNR